MITIYEGPDGTGKTTAAFQHVRYSDAQYIHNWCKPQNEVDTLSEIMKELILIESGKDIVMDRSYILSEYIYSKVLKRHSWLNDNTLFYFAEMLNRVGAKVILYLFKDIKHLKIKEEDKDLPFEELNSCYDLIITSFLAIDNIEVIYIDDREKTNENS